MMMMMGVMGKGVGFTYGYGCSRETIPALPRTREAKGERVGMGIRDREMSRYASSYLLN
jgi:hypothetical protein